MEHVHVHEHCPDIFKSCELKGCVECLLYFLENGADPNSKNEFGYTPLHIVVRYENSKECLEILLKNGADARIKNVFGKTPLHNVAGSEGANFKKWLEILLKNGADANSKDTDGDTPLQFFLTIGQKKLRKAKKRYFDYGQNNFYKLLRDPEDLILRNI